MIQKKQLSDLDFDINDIINIIFKEKFLILIFVVLSLILCGIYIKYKKPIYQSKIYVNILNQPPLINNTPLNQKFKNILYSKKNLEIWNLNNKDYKIDSKYLDTTKKLENYDFLKSQMIVSFAVNQDEYPEIIIRSNDKKLISNIFQYANNANRLISTYYSQKFKLELDYIESNLSNLHETKSIVTILNLNRFVNAINVGENIYHINHPTLPKKLSPKINLLFVVTFLSSLILACILVLFKATILNRKEMS